MAISTSVAPLEYALWPQGDIRDPLGIWGARVGVTGDATGNPVTVNIRVPAARRSAYVYTCYAVTPVMLSGAPTAGAPVKCRLLTNWPNIDPQAGVQGYSTWRAAVITGSTTMSAPQHGPEDPLIVPQDRFILLFDPRAEGGDLDIVQLEWQQNLDAATYSFEAYGYYWDRSVLQAPGGPRHPGQA